MASFSIESSTTLSRNLVIQNAEQMASMFGVYLLNVVAEEPGETIPLEHNENLITWMVQLGRLEEPKKIQLIRNGTCPETSAWPRSKNLR